jgi:hypothetical protein
MLVIVRMARHIVHAILYIDLRSFIILRAI